MKSAITYANAPLSCDICDNQFDDGKMYDSNTGRGWGNLCSKCFKMHGLGLGMGRGQEYTRQADGSYLKTGG